MRIYWSGAQRCNLVKPIWPNDQAYRGPSFPNWKPLPATSKFRRSARSPLCSIAPSPSFSRLGLSVPLPMHKSLSDSRRRAPNSSKAPTSGRPSKKSVSQEKPPQKPWTDAYHPAAAKEVLRLSSTDARKARIRSAIAETLQNPYINEKKKGKLKGCRAAEFSLDGVQHRALYELDEKERIVYFWCVAPREGVYGIVKSRVR